MEARAGGAQVLQIKMLLEVKTPILANSFGQLLQMRHPNSRVYTTKRVIVTSKQKPHALVPRKCDVNIAVK